MKERNRRMRKLSKVLCVVLCLMLSVDLAGVQTFAADVKESENDMISTENDIVDDAEVENNTDEEDVSDTGENSDNLSGTDVEDVSEDNPLYEGESAQTEPEVAKDIFKVELNTDYTGILVTLLKEISEAEEYEVNVKDSKDEVIESATFTKELETVEVLDLKKAEKYTVEVNVIKDGTIANTWSVPVMLLDTPSVKITSGVSSAVISWNKVDGATSYIVTNVKTGEVIENVTETSYSAKKLTNGTKYEFRVKAIVKLKDETNQEFVYESREGSAVASPQVAKPGKTTGLTGMDGDNSAILTWNKVSGAETYNIYRYNYSTKKWELIKTKVTKTTYTNKKLSAGKKYKYRVAAVNAGGTGAQSDSFIVKVKKTPGTKVRTIGYKAIVKSRAPIFTGKTSKTRVKYLQPGTRITTIDYGKGRYQFQLSNGKTYWISKDRLTFTASIWTTKDYSTKVKTDFVNKKGYKSSTKYLIWINQYTQRVMIYTGKKGHWKLIRSCRCATGTHLHMTPKGIHKITYKEKGWFYRTTYEKPIVHFKGANSFHSRIKNYKGGYADATIGRPRSAGCVRLYDEDIQFIYKKCPIGTTVVSH